MLKPIFLLTSIIFMGSSYGQNAPTLFSVSYDTLCHEDNDEVFMTVTIEDLDMDSTYISSVNLNNSVIDPTLPNIISGPATHLGTETLRTFTIKGTPNNGNPSGLNLADVTIEVIGAIGVEGPPVSINLSDIPVYGPISVSLDLSSITACNTDNPFDISGFASPAGGVFTWGNHEPTNGLFDPKDFSSNPGDGVFYTYENTSGCSAETSDFPSINIAPLVAVTSSPSSCGSADGSASATITGSSGPYDVFWTTGFTEQLTGSLTSSVSNLSSGTYYININDNDGCAIQGVAQISDSDLVIEDAISDESCPGSGDGAIDLNVSGGTVDDYFWSNGSEQEDITDLIAGEYTVHIHTEENCQGFKTYFVNAPSPLGVDVIAIQGEDCQTGDTGNIDITTTGGSGDYSWNWDSGASTMEDFNNPGVGLHECIITDNFTGCSFAWTENVPDFGAPSVNIDGVIKPNCQENNGEIDLSISQNFAPIASILWSNGASTEDLVGLDAGTYSVTVTDTDGCFTSEMVTLGYERPYQPSICLVTVDSSYIYNEIVWEKIIGEEIDGFKVYRETHTAGIFELVADRPYDLESKFMDNAASPVDRSWRYYITTYDACGIESYPSFIHKTIHTVSATSNGTDYNIYWDNYEGLSYSDVDLYRYDNTNGWQNVQTFSTGTNSASDTPSITSGLDYFVSFNLTDGCTSTKATDYNSSRSNKSDTAADLGESTTYIEDNEFGMVNIYPNPTSSVVNLFIEQYDMFEKIELRDINGRILMTKSVNKQNEFLDIEEYASGVYFISIISGDQAHQQKIIKK
jgi:hypothetical protein